MIGDLPCSGDRGEDRLWHSLRILASVEGHADAFFPAPHDVTRLSQPVARDAQGEPVGKPQRAVDFECRARLGDVANRAGDRVSTELDGSGFQDAVTRCDAVLGHDQMIDVMGRVARSAATRFRPENDLGSAEIKHHKSKETINPTERTGPYLRILTDAHGSRFTEDYL